MILNLILRNTYQLSTGQFSAQYLQQTILYDLDVVLFVFERTYQLWNIRQNKKLFETKSDQRVFFFCNNAFIDEFTVAFISYEQDYPVPYLGSIDLRTSEIKKLADMPKQDVENYEKLLVVKNEKGFDIIVSNGAKSEYLFYRDGKIEELKYEGTNTFESYSLDTYSVFNTTSSTDTLQFYLCTNGNAVKHVTKIPSKGQPIQTIKRNNQFEAMIVCSKDKQSNIYLYNLQNGVVVETREIKFQVEYLLQRGDRQWVACRTYQVEQSFVEVQDVFNQGSQSIKREIPEWQRIENEFYIGFVVKAENGVTNIETLTLVKKQSLYIHMIEELGLIKDCGNEIVKAVINNLF